MSNHYRTVLHFEKEYPRISHGNEIFLIGSCFSDRIGKKFNEYLFRSHQNPFGVTYNPISISDQLIRIVKGQLFNEADFMALNGGWSSLELHGSFLSPDQKTLKKKTDKTIQRSSKALSAAGHLIITFGTAWVYEWEKSGRVVNNCHKIPSKEFQKRLLRLDDILKAFEEAYRELKTFNADIEIIYTLSPVRHLRDGFEGNTLSKSILRMAIDELIKSHGGHYFPTYEIMMDELRDYRFYAKDMIHPSDLAIDILWERTTEALIHPESLSLFPEIESLNKAARHKAFDPNSTEYKNFIESSCDKAQKLIEENPGLNASELLQDLRKKGS